MLDRGGSLRVAATSEQPGDTVVEVIDQVQPADGMPGLAKELVGTSVQGGAALGGLAVRDLEPDSGR